MHLETQQQRTNRLVAELLASRFPTDPLVRTVIKQWIGHAKHRQRCEQLDALGNNPLPTEVDRIMDYEGYTKTGCSICKQIVADVIVIENSDPEESNTEVCADCTIQMAWMFKEHHDRTN